MLSERARRSIGSVLLLVCVGAALPGALGQTTRPQETFRSGVSILELAASVLVRMREGVIDLGTITRQIRIE